LVHPRRRYIRQGNVILKRVHQAADQNQEESKFEGKIKETNTTKLKHNHKTKT